MKNILLDLRGQALAVVVAEGEAIQYRTFVEGFSIAERKQAAETLDRISRESGIKLDRVHVIVPADAVTVATHAVPAMSASDAEKVIRRKLARETGTEDPVFRLLPLSKGGDRQVYLVETVDRDALTGLLAFFRSSGITVRSCTTASQANLKAIDKAPSAPGRRTALIDLGRAHIELAVVDNTELLFYQRNAVPAVEAVQASAAGVDAERIGKMRVYRTVESVYTAYLAYQNEFPDAPIDAVRISGAGHSLPGIADVLKETAGVAVTPLNLLGEEHQDGPLFTALAGLVLAVNDGTAVNYLPRDLSGRPPMRKAVRIAAACAYALTLVLSAALIQAKHVRTSAALQSKQQEIAAREMALQGASAYLQHRDQLSGLLRREAAFYPLFGYLADRTPDGVLIAGLSFSQRSGSPVMEIDFITPPVSEVGTRRLLSKITAMIDRSGLLLRQGEPSLSVVRQQDKVQTRFKVLCEVLPHETSRQ